MKMYYKYQTKINNIKTIRSVMIRFDFNNTSLTNKRTRYTKTLLHRFHNTWNNNIFIFERPFVFLC